ncbi:TetR-like C-terminal domain-containing protein [Nocardia sp. CDC153]|uniref:TetR-like C-terminal domain-containing protein n=1 Tax=Nocardia sp. CDC153 TaxID=3112167 RepID=UPI002DC0274F|nr:TetR-like C-terminal domain-containing protein [Nocardia sp. CDC153]MEC3958932.1 TetR-like C-terminal domain-containing protein [Nocardia sp. CDC153]
MARVGLTPERIIAEAAAVADEVGLERLTLAAVAQRCGVSLPGLYKHIDNLEAVKRELAIVSVGELATALADATAGLSGRDALRAICTAYRDYARARPGRYAAGIVAPDADDDTYLAAAGRAYQVLTAALRGYQLAESDLVHAVRMVRTVCHGMVTLEIAGGFGLPESVDDTFERLQDALHSQFSYQRTE